MNYIYFVFLLFFLLIYRKRKQKKKLIVQHIHQKYNHKENNTMIEFAKRFIGKECIVYYFDSQIQGIIKEIDENGNAILLEDKYGNATSILNLEYVIRIQNVQAKKLRTH